MQQDELEEMVSYRKDVTGIAHTIFIFPKGNARHSPRVKVAIDLPDSVDPRGGTAVITLDGAIIGEIDPALTHQVQRFIARNRGALLDYWHYQIDTTELQRRLRPIED
jgi:hypothetical protein